MSDVQALETETQIPVEPVDEVVVEPNEAGEVKTEDDGSIELTVEEAGEPPVRGLSRYARRLKKKDAAIEEAEARAAKAEEERKLLLEMVQNQNAASTELTEPDEDDFDDPAAYKAARSQYIQQLVEKTATEKAQELHQQSQQNITQQTQIQESENAINGYYDAADSLKIKNFSQLEENATNQLGENFIKTLIASTTGDDAAKIIASMGASPGKTAEIARLAQSNPTKAFASALRFEINPALNPAKTSTTPEPEEQLEPGASPGLVPEILKGVKFE